jgi:high-affinity Fe2+/Pb2+ permease
VKSPPSPQEHPAAYGGSLAASTTALLVYECNTRLGFGITELEAGTLIALVIAGYFAAFGKKKKS